MVFYNELQSVANLLILLKAVIGIEPMNKGFAVHLRHLLQSVIERYRPVNTGFSIDACKPILLNSGAYPLHFPLQCISLESLRE